MAYAVNYIFRKIWLTNEKIISPNLFKFAVEMCNNNFKGNNQEDAHEFIIFMIDILHEDLNKNIYKKTITENEKKEKDEQLKYGLEWKKFLLRNKSILIDLFYGQFKSNITCSICKNSVSNFYPFSTLSLNLNTEDNNHFRNKINNSNNKVNNNINSNKKNINHTTSLYELFENLSSVEILSDDDKWYCKICDKKVKAFKNLEINYIPKILIIQLNRFDKYNNKIEKKIEFPINNLDLSKYILSYENNNKAKEFNLFGLINHFGSLNFGHYTAICKNSINNKWYIFNDSVVEEIDDESDIVTNNAYLLFYRVN